MLKKPEELTDKDVPYENYLWTTDNRIVVLSHSSDYDCDYIFGKEDDGYLPTGAECIFLSTTRNGGYDYFAEHMGAKIENDIHGFLTFDDEEKEAVENEIDEICNVETRNTYEYACAVVAVRMMREKGFKAFRISVYDHSGCHWSWNEVGEGDDLRTYGWDNSTAGILFLKCPITEHNKTTEVEVLERHGKRFNDVESGCVYNIDVYKWNNWINADEPDKTFGRWEDDDSCCNFIGSEYYDKRYFGEEAEAYFGVKIDWERSGVKAKEAV